MSKTLAQLITDTRRHIAMTDTSNTGNITNVIITGWLNEAYREAIDRLRHLPMTSRDYSVATGGAVTLNAATTTIDHARIKNPDDSDNGYIPLEVIKYDQLMEIDPDWENSTTGIPAYLVQRGFTAGQLYPLPKASLVALTTPLRTSGLEVPSDLSADSDVPDLPASIQDALPHWPAYRAFSEQENQIKATEHLTLWRSRLKDAKGLALEFNKKLKGFRWEGGSRGLGLAGGYAE